MPPIQYTEQVFQISKLRNQVHVFVKIEPPPKFFLEAYDFCNLHIYANQVNIQFINIHVFMLPIKPLSIIDLVFLIKGLN